MHSTVKRMRVDNHNHNNRMEEAASTSAASTTYGDMGRLSYASTTCGEINDDHLLDQFFIINEKSAQCMDVYKKYPSIIENEKAAYAIAQKRLRDQLDKTRAELLLDSSDSLATTTTNNSSKFVVDQKNDMTWKFIEALERTKLQLARVQNCHKKL